MTHMTNCYRIHLAVPELLSFAESIAAADAVTHDAAAAATAFRVSTTLEEATPHINGSPPKSRRTTPHARNSASMHIDPTPLGQEGQGTLALAVTLTECSPALLARATALAGRDLSALAPLPGTCSNGVAMAFVLPTSNPAPTHHVLNATVLLEAHALRPGQEVMEEQDGASPQLSDRDFWSALAMCMTSHELTVSLRLASVHVEHPDSIVIRLELSLAAPIHTPQSLAATAAVSARPQTLAQVLSRVFPTRNLLPVAASTDVTASTLADLFGAIDATRAPAAQVPLAANLAIVTQLYPFQQRSVSWCLARELGDQDGAIKRATAVAEQQARLAPVCPEQHLWFDRYLNALVRAELNDNTAPLFTETFSIVPSVNGWLCDEMGLGKTLVMLALLAHNRFVPVATPEITESAEESTQESIKSVDPTSENVLDMILTAPPSAAPTPIKTTLIVTPPALTAQWQAEVRRHAPSLSVFVYEGGAKHPATTDISQYDIVLTSFSKLSAELDLTRPDHTRTRRFDRKHERPTSILTRHVWWRVVMDEAQMLGTATSKVAQTLAAIPRTHSWCVTGTPFSRHIAGDLGNVASFLGHPDQRHVESVMRGGAALFAWYLAQIMRRTCKAGVEHELALPPQHHQVIRLQMDIVEADFYHQLAERLRPELAQAFRTIARANEDGTIDLQNAHATLASALATLRLASNHPSLARRAMAGIERNVRARGPGRGRAAAAAGGGGEGADGLDHDAFSIAVVNEQMVTRASSEYFSAHRERAAKVLYLVLLIDRLGEYDRATQLLEGLQDNLTLVMDHLAEDRELDQHFATAHALGKDARHLWRTVDAATRQTHIQQHQVLFFMAGYAHIRGDADRETELYAAAEGIRRMLLAPLAAAVERAQEAVVVRDNSTPLVRRLEIPASGVWARRAQAMMQQVEQQITGRGGLLVPATRPVSNNSAKGKAKLKRRRTSGNEGDSDDDDNTVANDGPGGEAGAVVSLLRGLHGALEQTASIASAVDRFSALVGEWSEALEQKLLASITQQQDGDDDPDAGGNDYDAGIEGQHMAEAYLSQLQASMYDLRHFVNRTAPLNVLDHDAKADAASQRKKRALGRRGSDDVVLAQLADEGLVAVQRPRGHQISEREKPLREARLAVIRGLDLSLTDAETMLRRLSREQKVFDADFRDLCVTGADALSLLARQAIEEVTCTERRIAAYHQVFNARVEYYADLQSISDSVATPNEVINAADQGELVLRNQAQLKQMEVRAVQETLPGLAARRRYMRLLAQSVDSDGQVHADCLICDEELVEGAMTPCGHMACRPCMTMWLTQRNSCPECRQQVMLRDCARVLLRLRANPVEATADADAAAVADAVADAIASSSSSPFAAAPDSVSAGGEVSSAASSASSTSPSAASPVPAAPDVAEEQQPEQPLLGALPGWYFTPIHGRHGAKVKAVVQFLKTMTQREPGAKALVFTQFDDLLQVIKRTLKVNGVAARDFSPAAVAAFQSDATTKCLLLNAKSQAAGLTLNAARYLLFVEPVANSAIDKQAIARVHRIGQTATTRVIRFLCEQTVEEEVHRLLETKYRNEQQRGTDGGTSIGAATKKAFSGRNEIVHPDDMVFCLRGVVAEVDE
ncbi:SNF2 family N-terminal domain-containing protein [Blastocladiella britannica]|nr:SNF2 family N-terminal domain-containing protein [Blastocladiella britannica]